MTLSGLNRLSNRLPAFVGMVIVIVAAGLGYMNYLEGRNAALNSANSRQNLLLEHRSSGLEDWFDTISQTLRTLAANPSTVQAMRDFAAEWAMMDAAARTGVRQAYVALSPYERGRRDELSRAEGEGRYHFIHDRYHAYFRGVNEVNEFYDIFLVDTAGNIVYSVFKEDDFGSSVTTGSLAATGIGAVYGDVVENRNDNARFSDFTPYPPSDNAVASFAAARIVDNQGIVIGTMIVQTNISSFASVLNHPQGLYETGQTFLVSDSGHLLVDSRFADGPRASSLVPITDHIASALRGEAARTSNGVGLTYAEVTAATMPVMLGNHNYALVAEQSNTEILAKVYEHRTEVTVLVTAVVLVISVIAWLYIRTVTVALDRIGQQMTSIANGDYSTEVKDNARGDEIGDIAERLVDFRGKLQAAAGFEDERKEAQKLQQTVIEELRAGLLRLADGDLSRPIPTAFAPEYEALREAFNDTLRNLSEAMSEVKFAAGSIRHGAVEITQSSDDLSTRTENQAATLEQTAAALDELTASVKSAAEGAKSVESIVVDAQSEAEQSGKIVGDAIAAMTEIEKSSEHISQIIGVIDDIAFQTNLLALNAGVEAARAGDAGKGFAVVASEVRALAQRSSEAAKEIKTLIRGSAKQVEHGVALVGDAGKALGTIVQSVTNISELIRNMAQGTSEQAIGLGEINIGVNQLDQVTQQNAAMVEQATAASHVLKQDAERLQELVGRFNVTENARVGSAATQRVPPRAAPQASGQAAFQSVREPHKQNPRAPSRQFQVSSNPSFSPAPAPIELDATIASRANGSTGSKEWIDF